MIYSVDILYKKLDLLVCKINEDERKWCFIPVFPSTVGFNQDELIEHIRQELKGSTSVWNRIEISELKFFSKIDHLKIYDPYSEILELKEINFIDTTEKCEIIPCSVFMAYYTGPYTPCVKSLKPEGLFDPIHTKLDMDNAYGKRSSSRFIDRFNEITTTMNNGNTKWNNVHTYLKELKSTLPDKTTVLPPPRIPCKGWLNTNMISKHLDGQFSRNTTKSSFLNPLAESFRIKGNVLSSVECLNLNSFLAENGIEFLTSSNVRQIIEQHVGGFWKNDDISGEKYPKNFVKDCLHELLGSAKNLHGHIDSYRSLSYSFEFVRQLKYEDPNLHIEFSLTDEVENQSCQSAVILAFECNQNYVLVYAKLDDFLERITKCKSSEDIQQLIESSVTFTDDMSRGQQVKWHRNLSFVYVAAFQDSVINKIEARLLAAGLRDINFISKKLGQVNFDEPRQCHTNDAIICFKFDHHLGSFHRVLPLRLELLDQWIFNEDTSTFTGPIVTLCPNISTYTIGRYSPVTVRTDVGSVYNLLFDSISILFQWRNS